MTTFGEPSIVLGTSQLEFATVNKAIRFAQGQAEAAFKGLMGVQSEQSNVADDEDPNVSRINFNSPDRRVLSLSQMRAQIDIRIPAGQKMQAFETLAGQSLKFHEAAIGLYGREFYSGDSLNFHIRADSLNTSVEINDFIYKRFMNPVLPGNAISAGLNFGCELGGYICILQINGVEDLRLNPNQVINMGEFIPKKAMKVVGRGILFAVSIRPIGNDATGYHPPESGEKLISFGRDFLSNHFENITGFSL